MVNKTEQFICHFATGKGYPQVFFNKILQSALKYKYRGIGIGQIPISPKDLTDAVFGVSVQDKLMLCGKAINGQRLIELFIASIYLKYLDAQNPEKILVVSIPHNEESYDVAVYITEKDGVTDLGDGKCKLTKPFTAYYIQVKEEFDFRACQADYSALKEGIDVASLKNKASRYDELVLIFMRDYAQYRSSDTQAFLNENKNVGLILMPSLDPKVIEISDGKDRGKVIKLEEGKFNFLLNIEEYIMHIVYDEPSFLVRMT